MDFKKGLVILVTLILLCLSLCPVYGADKFDLKLNLEKGRIFDFKMMMDSSIVQTLNGRDLKVNQQFGMTMGCEIADVEADGAAIMKITFNGMRLKQESPVGIIEYDSADPPAEISPAALGFAALVGANFTVKMSAKGEILEVRGVDDMFEAMFQKLGMDEEKSATIRKSLRDQFSDQALKEMTQQTSGAWPQNPVAVGDSWTNRITLSKGYPLVIENSYKLRDYKDGVAYLDIAAKITPNPDAAPMDFGAFKIKYSFSGTEEGSMQIQESNGFSCSGRITQQLSGLIEFSGTEMEGAMKWPMRMDSVVEFEIKERNAR